MFAMGQGALVRLNIATNKISPKGKQSIADALLDRYPQGKSQYHLQYLICDEWAMDYGTTALDISGPRLVKNGMQRLRVEDGLLLAAVLQSNQEITALNARDNDMAFGGQQAIVALGKACENHTMLTSLDLSRNYIKNEGFKAIHGLVRKDRLTSLSLNAKGSCKPFRT